MTNIDSFVSDYFNASKSTEYDKKIRASIPGYHALHEMTLDFLSSTLPKVANILIIGVGTGMELITLGVSNPKWTFTAIDLSEEMLSVCKDNIDSAGLSYRVKIICGGLDELSLQPIFHAATSILVSHFIKDRNDRKAFFQSIAKRLLDNGSLITADIVADRSDPSFEIFVKAWKAHYIHAGIPEEEAEEDFERSFNAVSFMSEEELIDLFVDGGFKGVKKFYQAFLFGGWVCYKA